MRLVLLMLTLATASLLACAGFAAKGTAEQAVTRFHQQLDAGSYDEIYDQTDALFKIATAREQFLSILRSVHTKLGNVGSSTQTEFYSREEAGTNPGSYISLTYQTQFASGKGTEKFNYRVDGGQVHLVGYNISSIDLITK